MAGKPARPWTAEEKAFLGAGIHNVAQARLLHGRNVDTFALAWVDDKPVKVVMKRVVERMASGHRVAYKLVPVE